MDKQRAIEEVIIKQEIRDIMMRYARGVNRLDGELVKSCFHPDAVEQHGSYFGDTQLWADSLPDALRAGFQFTFHLLGNSLIEIDGNRASQETYFIGYHRLHPDENGEEKDVLFGGRYLGIHESRDGGPWLIVERSVVHDWSRVDKVAEKWLMVDEFNQGGHSGGRTDLVYDLLTKGPFSR